MSEVEFRLRTAPPVFRPAFSEWVDKGHVRVLPNQFGIPPTCPLCGAPGQTCTHEPTQESSMAKQKPKGSRKPTNEEADDQTTPEDQNDDEEEENRAPSSAELASGNIAGTGGIEPASDEDQKEAVKSNRVAEPRDADIIEQGDPIRLKGKKVNNMLVIERDLYRRVVPRRAKRPTYVLIYTAGTAIPLTQVEELEEQSKSQDDDSSDSE